MQTADCLGTVRINGLPFADVEQAKAARHLIVTCEAVVEIEQLHQTPDVNALPFFCVDAVVHVPMGAYPTACYRYYDYDPIRLYQYRHAAMDKERYQAYLEQEIMAPRSHAEMMAHIDPCQLEKIKADPRTGYAVGLDRKTPFGDGD